MINNGNSCVGTYNVYGTQPAPVDGWTDPYAQSKISWLNSQGGIMFVDMYTNITDSNNNDAFFQTIGLNRSDLIDDNIVYQLFQGGPAGNTGCNLDATDFYNVTTRDFMPLGLLLSGEEQTLGTFKMAVNGFQMYLSGYNFIDSSVSNQITFSNSPISSQNNGGHYLIQIYGGYENNYINQNAQMQFSELVPTFYQSQGGFIQTMSSSQIIYTHKGVPFNLSNVSIRVVNPITKLPLSNALLGGNSTIYLQVSNEIKAKPEEVAKMEDKKSKVS
jgi:hypothetical protein